MANVVDSGCRVLLIGGVTVVFLLGLLPWFCPIPDSWEYWKHPEQLYPEGVTERVHVRLPEKVPVTPTRTPLPVSKGPADTSTIHLAEPTAKRMPIPTPTPRIEPGEVFFLEDFSKVRDGYLPDGWTGGPDLAVMPNGQKRILRPFAFRDEHKVQMAAVNVWPEDFRLEWVLRTSKRQRSYDPSYTMEIGSITVHLFVDSGDRSRLQLQETMVGVSSIKDTLVRLTVEKRGPVVKAYIDGKEVALVRVQTFAPPKHLTFIARDPDMFWLELIRATGL